MDLVSRDCPEGFWPVYKGASFDLWTPDTGTYYAWADPERVLDHLQGKRARAGRRGAFAEFDAEWRSGCRDLPCLNGTHRLSGIVTTRRTAARVRAALVPPRVFLVSRTTSRRTSCGPGGTEQDEAYLLGILSSLSLDWYARRFVETHVTFFRPESPSQSRGRAPRAAPGPRHRAGRKARGT